MGIPGNEQADQLVYEGIELPIPLVNIQNIHISHSSSYWVATQSQPIMILKNTSKI